MEGKLGQRGVHFPPAVQLLRRPRGRLWACAQDRVGGPGPTGAAASWTRWDLIVSGCEKPLRNACEPEATEAAIPS